MKKSFRIPFFSRMRRKAAPEEAWGGEMESTVRPTPETYDDPSLGPFQHHPRGTVAAMRADHYVMDGVNRNALIWDDPMGKSFPRPWHVVFFNMLVAAVLDWLCFCGMAIPGTPVRSVLAHLRLEARPAVGDFLWDYVVRLADALPYRSVTFWTALLSAVFGVLSVGLFTCILLRVGYLVRNECGEGSLRREAMARRLSALAGGLCLAVSSPMLVTSTRTLPTTFSFLLMLVVVWLFSAFQHGGRWWRLALFSFALGVSCASFGTAWVFAPLLLILACGEMMRWRMGRSPWNWLALLLPLLAGLMAYVPYTLLLFRRGAWLGLYSSPFAAFRAIVSAQLHSLILMRFSPAVLVFGSILLIPWATLFLFSRRSPWFYEWMQISIRLLIALGILSTLFDLPYAQHNLFPGGLNDPPLVPSAILALCFGYVVGEFWCLGQPQPLVDRLFRHRVRRWLASLLALLLPLGVFASLPQMLPAIRVPADIWSAHIAEHLLETRGERNVFMLEAPLDDILLLESHVRREPVVVFSASRFYDPIYQSVFALRFDPDSDIARALRAGQLENALRYWLNDEEHLNVTISNIRPDLLYEYAYLLPESLAYSTHATADAVAPERLPDAMRRQLPFWRYVAEASREPPPFVPLNPFARYHAYLNAHVASVINNAGVLCADNHLLPLADTLFELAGTVNSNNISARMNSLRMAELLRPGAPETKEKRAAWSRDDWRLGGQRWALGIRFGYLHDPLSWMREGYVWALSGLPLVEPAARRLPPLAVAADGTFSHFIDQAFIAVATVQNNPSAYRFRLVQDPWDSHAILELCRLALRDKQPDIADAYIDEAVNSTGLSEKDVVFERILTDFVRLHLFFETSTAAQLPDSFSSAAYATFPETTMPTSELLAAAHVRHPKLWTARDGSLRSPADTFRRVSRIAVHDMRVWMTLLLLANGEQPETDNIEKTLRNSRPNDFDVWTTLASVHLDRNDLKKARTELDHALSLSIERPALWELRLTIAERTNNRRLAQAAEKHLLLIAPQHFLVFQAAGRKAYDAGDLDEAIKIFRRGIFLERNPVLLNNLAHVLAEQSADNCGQALLLLDEAIRRDPSQPMFYNTRARVHLRAGQPEEALADIRRRFRAQRLSWNEYILLADIYQALGDRDRVARAIRAARTTFKVPPPPSEQHHVVELELYAAGQ